MPVDNLMMNEMFAVTLIKSGVWCVFEGVRGYGGRWMTIRCISYFRVFVQDATSKRELLVMGFFCSSLYFVIYIAHVCVFFLISWLDYSLVRLTTV